MLKGLKSACVLWAIVAGTLSSVDKPRNIKTDTMGELDAKVYS